MSIPSVSTMFENSKQWFYTVPIITRTILFTVTSIYIAEHFLPLWSGACLSDRMSLSEGNVTFRIPNHVVKISAEMFATSHIKHHLRKNINSMRDNIREYLQRRNAYNIIENNKSNN